MLTVSNGILSVGSVVVFTEPFIAARFLLPNNCVFWKTKSRRPCRSRVYVVGSEISQVMQKLVSMCGSVQSRDKKVFVTLSLGDKDEDKGVIDRRRSRGRSENTFLLTQG
ncbi:hypothetical protein ISN45_At03g017860 [Arabidopsis thaliana x Arabidopsis arenosa]|nr:hypothetical protein ISN45_At03g017860 [Arabidopsis thaliana x Arabidopsis arenosa]